MRPIHRRIVRGQNLVLFSLMVLLLALLVLMTLSIGAVTKDKIEAQTVADATAYSNAVITARTYNTLALLNRTQVSHMVAITSVQALISYATHVRSMVRATGDKLFMEWFFKYVPLCGKGNPCGCLGATDLFMLWDKMYVMDANTATDFWDLDQRAADLVHAHWIAATGLYVEEAAVYLSLKNALRGQTLGEKLTKSINRGQPFAPLSIPPSFGGASADVINEREVHADDCSPFGPFHGAPIDSGLCAFQASSNSEVNAAMGGRQYPFINSRLGSSRPLDEKVNKLIMGDYLIYDRIFGKANLAVRTIEPFHTGSAYFHGGVSHGSSKGAAAGFAAWGEDHSLIQVTYGSGGGRVFKFGGFFPIGFCPEDTGLFPIWGAESRVVGTNALGFISPKHEGGSGIGGLVVEVDKYGPVCDDPRRHWAGINAFGIWPFFFEFNPKRLMDSGDNYGEPKNLAVLERNYAGAPATPWGEIDFRFSFTPTTSERFQGSPGTTRDGVDLSRQLVTATGMTYYHRRGHWREPPNLLNPYWRATLVRSDIDAQGPIDNAAAMTAISSPAAADLARSLQMNGFKGAH